MNTFNIALTGHRPGKLGGYDITTPQYQSLQADLEQYIRYEMAEHPDSVIICHSGLALGADTVWSKAIINMRKQYPDSIKFHAHIPSFNQANRWFKASDVDFWRNQIKVADKRTVYMPESETSTAAIKKSMKDRNTGMVSHADVLLAIYDGSTGGTGHAVNAAHTLGVPVTIIHPKRYFG